MRSRRQIWIVLACCCLIAGCSGCPQDTPPVGPNGSDPVNGQAAVDNGSNGNEVPTPPEPEPGPPATVPEVNMTDTDRETCKVFVGDVMPEAELPDSAGQAQSLSTLYGEKLTVMYFWQSGESAFAQMAAEDALEFLAKDIGQKYAGQDVAVLGVNVGDSAEAAGQRMEAAGADFPNFRDADGAYFAQIATANLPRTYLIDADAKIIWFDWEFSQITRDSLRQAIDVKLTESPAAEQ